MKDELTDKIDDETSNRNQTLDAVRNAAQSSAEGGRGGRRAPPRLRRTWIRYSQGEGRRGEDPQGGGGPAAPAADAPESSPGD